MNLHQSVLHLLAPRQMITWLSVCSKQSHEVFDVPIVIDVCSESSSEHIAMDVKALPFQLTPTGISHQPELLSDS